MPLRYVFVITFILFICFTALSLWLINAGIKPTLMSYAESETKKIASMVINQAINKKVANVMDINEIIETVPHKDQSRASTTRLNTEIINRILGEVTNQVQNNLQEAEKGKFEPLDYSDVKIDPNQSKKLEGIVFSVPLGQATNNAILGNMGPSVPVRFHAVGDVHSDVKSKVKPYGINNAYVEVAIHVQVNVQIIIPFSTKTTLVEQDIPVAMGIIQGDVPQFFGGNGHSPSISIPMN
ncbi:sporulation protein YunB [Bacillus smithii]|uniref:sporulation protein YunB n=1 Tax=Bacillus smithii TaxID=1479 RepID=UPI0002F96233|nr:sporulation protein YunB [Bacillus smithii]